MALPRPSLVDLSAYLDPSRIVFFNDAVTKHAALQALATELSQAPAVSDANAFMAAIFERERVSSTGIGNGIAVPHAKLPSIEGFAIAVGIAQDGIHFDSRDGEPVRILVMIAASDQQREAYLKVLATVASTLKRDEVCAALLTAQASDAVISALCTTGP